MSVRLPDSLFPSYASEGWILDEDRALRDHLKGVVVSDHSQQARPVEVWFGHPDQELREQKYPYITLDLVNIQEGLDRVHRGDLYISDPPAWWGLEPLTGSQIGWLMEMPTPIDLDYQISTWARNPRHDRQILNQLLNSRRIPPRGGLLFTADRKDRRLDFQGHAKQDTVEDSKRLFHNIFRVRVSSEIPWAHYWIGDGGNSIGAQPFGVATNIQIGFRARIANMGITMDAATIRVGTVLAWDDAQRRADLDIGGERVDGVPVTETMSGLVLMPEDEVAVSLQPGTGSPPPLAEQHPLVLGLEYRPEQ